MDVNAVLEGTLSPDLAVRTNAEQQLQQAADADFSGYLSTLATKLAEEQAPATVRQSAALALKNALTARDFARLRQIQERWLNQVDPNMRIAVKQLALKTLSSDETRVGMATAQLITAIAAIELPRSLWPDLMGTLVNNIAEGKDHQKQASLTTIGYVCDSDDLQLRESLAGYSNSILTAVIQGARKEEPNPDVRQAAMTALSDSLDFVRSNFDNEGERNYIMQVVCEATQAEDVRVQEGAFGCLNRIMNLYYDKMRFYMEKALFGLTVQGMRSEEEDVAKLAIEFWCTVCEEEISIEDDNSQVSHYLSLIRRLEAMVDATNPKSTYYLHWLNRLKQAQAEGSTELREYHNFARIATNEVVPVLLELLAKQDEDAADDEYNVSRAAYQCLSLYAQTVGGVVVQPVLGFVEKHLRSEDWHYRDAAVSAFGAIVEGPEDKMLDPIVKQALPILIAMMSDPVLQVKDSAAYALGRITESLPESIDPTTHLTPLISALFTGLASNPRMASSCCWALMNLADRFAGEPGAQTNPLSPHFQASVTHLLQVTERPDADSQLRTAAYEVLNSFVSNAANDSLPMVASLSEVILERLSKTVPMQQQVVSVEDKLALEDMQTSLVSVVLAIISRLEAEVKPQADRIMQICLQLLNTVGPKSSVPDTVFAAIGALANGLETDFLPYMEAFAPYLFKGLENQDEPGLCSMAIGLVSDITRAIGEKVQPWCDDFMNRLLNDLQSNVLGNQFKPAILQCFGDIAQAIGPHFETYLAVVAQVLQQASTVNANQNDSMDLLEYIVSLREGIMDAWDGCIVAMKSGHKTQLLREYVEHIFQLLHLVYADPNRTESLLRSTMGVIGDLSEAFPNGEYAQYFRADWLTAMAKETRANREFSERTTATARWAREQIKRQIGPSPGVEDFPAR